MLPSSSHQNIEHSSDEKIGIFNNNPATPPADSIGNIFNIGLARDMHLVELRNIQALIAHKQQELNVYTSARQLIETRDAGEPCLVFLADNVFVLRSREQALPILDRQCGHFQRAIKGLEQEQKAMEEKVQLMDRLHMTDEGLVDIREPIKESEGLTMGQKGKRRIAHKPKWEKKPAADVNKQQQHWQVSAEQPNGTLKAMAEVQVKSDESGSGPIHPLKSLEKEIGKAGEKKQREIPPRPKGVPEADYKKFLALVNSLELSEDDDEEDEQEDEEEKNEDLLAARDEESTEMEEPRGDDDDDERMEEDEENGGESGESEEDDEDIESKNQQAAHSVAGTSGSNGKKRRVRFLPSLVQLDDEGQPTDGQSKSILKNKNEHSPIDAAEMNKIVQRDRRQVWPTSKETVKDNVLEQAAKPSRQLRSTPNKRQKQKHRPVSQWKARRMGLPTESDEENDNNP